MALKRKITKAEHTALDPKLQAEYKAEGEDFVLDAEGFEDPAELKRAKDREVEARKTAEKKAADAAEELRIEREKTARSTGNVADLEKSYKEREKVTEKQHKDELAKRDAHLQATLVDSVAAQMAATLAGENAHLLVPFIKGRLTADLSGDMPLTRVLDKEGKPAAMSVDELQKEISGDGRFKTIVIASKGSGGGAAGNQGGGSGAPGGNKKFNELTEQERIAWFKSDPDGFNQASAANKAAMLDRPAVRQVA